jgi:hypothetical protein
MRVTDSERSYVLALRAVTVTPKASKPYVCTEPTCYKFGHAFSEVGWNGNGTTKGHVQISPAHKF